MAQVRLRTLRRHNRRASTNFPSRSELIRPPRVDNLNHGVRNWQAAGICPGDGEVSRQMVLAQLPEAWANWGAFLFRVRWSTAALSGALNHASTDNALCRAPLAKSSRLLKCMRQF